MLIAPSSETETHHLHNASSSCGFQFTPLWGFGAILNKNECRMKNYNKGRKENKERKEKK